MGDWKSNAFMQYVRQNVELFARAQTAMTSVNALMVTDVRRASETAPRGARALETKAPKRGRPKKTTV